MASSPPGSKHSQARIQAPFLHRPITSDLLAALWFLDMVSSAQVPSLWLIILYQTLLTATPVCHLWPPGTLTRDTPGCSTHIPGSATGHFFLLYFLPVTPTRQFSSRPHICEVVHTESRSQLKLGRWADCGGWRVLQHAFFSSQVILLLPAGQSVATCSAQVFTCHHYPSYPG